MCACGVCGLHTDVVVCVAILRMGTPSDWDTHLTQCVEVVGHLRKAGEGVVVKRHDDSLLLGGEQREDVEHLMVATVRGALMQVLVVLFQQPWRALHILHNIMAVADTLQAVLAVTWMWYMFWATVFLHPSYYSAVLGMHEPDQMSAKAVRLCMLVLLRKPMRCNLEARASLLYICDHWSHVTVSAVSYYDSDDHQELRVIVPRLTILSITTHPSMVR